MQNLIHGLGNLGNFQAILFLFGGALIGMVAGVIPGLSGVVILSIILIFVYHLNLTDTLALFVGSECGTFYSASVTAILLNTPAHPEAFPITFDGYPMARKGQPGRALGLSACSTLVGGLIGCGVLVGVLQVMDSLARVFHPPEFVALVTLAMLLVGTLGADSIIKAFVSAGAGLMLASIGPSPVTGAFRYTFGATGLFNGLSLIALSLGLFAIPQLVMVFGTGTPYARQDMTGKELGDIEVVNISKGYTRQLLGGIAETFRHWGVLLQSGVVGAVTGMVPGIGGFTGNFMAYGIAKSTARKGRRELFGTGVPEGIIAPEGSSLAKEAGHKVPLIGLGIPGGISGALFIGALAIKGLTVGPGFQKAYPNVTGEIVWIMVFAGLIGTLAGVIIGPRIANITRLPGPMLVPFIFAISVSGPFLVDVQFFAVIELLVFGIVGLTMRRLKYPLGSFILGLVLGPTFESNFYLMHDIYPGFSWITKRPLADGIFLLAIGVLVLKFFELHGESKKRKALLDEELAHDQDPLQIAKVKRDYRRRLAPYPLLAMLASTTMLVVSLFFIIYGATHYSFVIAAMPVIGGIAVAIPCLMILPRDIYHYRLHRQSKTEMRLARQMAEQNTSQPERALVSVGSSDHAVVGAPMTLTDVVEAAEAVNESATLSPSPVPLIEEKSWKSHGQFRREFIAFVWLCALVGLCWLVGFPIGVAIFMVVYGMISTRRYLKVLYKRLLFSALSCGLMWFVTYEMFNLTKTEFTPFLHL